METGNVNFAPTEIEELTEYHPPSRAAIAALLLGLLSPTALIQPLLWVVPAVTVVVSLIALRQIAGSEGRASGRWLAVTGLLLALFFGPWSITWSLSQHFLLTSQARRHAQTWWDLVQQEKLYEAHQLTLYFEERARKDETLESIYAEPSGEQAHEHEHEHEHAAGEPEEMADPAPGLELSLADRFRQWRSAEPLATILSHSTDAQVEFDRHLKSIVVSSDRREIQLLFQVRYREDGKPRSLPVRVIMERTLVADGAYWAVAGVMHPEDVSFSY